MIIPVFSVIFFQNRLRHDSRSHTHHHQHIKKQHESTKWHYPKVPLSEVKLMSATNPSKESPMGSLRAAFGNIDVISLIFYIFCTFILMFIIWIT